MFGVSKGANTTGQVSTGNSSATPLGSVGTFTGTYVSCIDFASVVVACITDQNATLYVDFSTDGSTANSTLTFTVTASTNEVHRIAVTRAYVRIRLENTSGVAQSSLNLSLILGYQGQLTSSISSTIQSDADASVVRPIDFNIMVAEGLYQNRQNTIKDGINSIITSANVPQDIWTIGGTYTGFPTGATEEGQIVVGGADTGTVYYSYLLSDTSTDYVIASKAITGAGSYNLGHNIWRSNFMYFVSSSATAFNAGVITLRHRTTTANVFCRIEIGISQSYTSAYTVPYGSSIYMDRITGSIRGNQTANMDGYFWYRAYGESPRLRFPFVLQFGTLYFDDIDFLLKIPERTDFIPRITSSSQANATEAVINYRLIKVKTL
jgi:hypothetical protein